MATGFEASAVLAFPELQRLLDAERRPWRLRTEEDQYGKVLEVRGLCQWEAVPGSGLYWSDALKVWSPTNAKGGRNNPDGEQVAHFEDMLRDVVNSLLTLPLPGQHNAPTHVLPRVVGVGWAR